MLNFIGAAVGVAIGLLAARRRGGNRADLAQYAAVFAILGFLAGTFVMLLLPAPG